MSVDPNAPAFPQPSPTLNGNGDWIYTEQPGLSIRAYMATQIIAGLGGDPKWDDRHHSIMADESVRRADVLISALNREESA